LVKANYIVTPMKLGYEFNPANRNYPAIDTSYEDQNFVITPDISPAVPENLAATTGLADNKIVVHLSWTPNQEGDLDGYRVYRNEEFLTTLSKSATYYIDQTVLEGATYNYCISAFDKSGNESGYSSVATIFIPASEPFFVSVSGIISQNTVWKYPGVYTVIGSVVVKPGAVLTIESGVIVKFQNATQLRMEGSGTLVASGAKERKIIFTSADTNPVPGKWIGIVFDYSSGDNVIKHATVEYAETGIDIYKSSASVEDCLITKNLNGIKKFYDSGIVTSTILGKRCVISSNTACGIQVQNSIVSIEDSVITDNGTYGIRFSSGAAMSVSKSTVSYNQGYGIYAYVHSGASVKISSSSVSFNEVGVYVRGEEGKSEISRNRVESNNGYGIVLDWLGVAKVADNRIGCNGSDGLRIKNYWQNIEVLNNLISDNLGSGVYLTGAVYSEDHLSILGNTIIGNRNSGMVGEVTGIYERGQLKCAYNNIVGNSPYAVSWLSSVLLEAENNWWGTTDPEVIENAIYDYKDNSALGLVKYESWLTSFCEAIPPDAPILAPVTKVSGVISANMVWKYPGIYVISGDITVEPGVTLTIEPGVEVRAMGYRGLTVNGALVASGTEERKIVFTSQRIEDLRPGRWPGIIFNDASNDNISLIKHATVEYAETGLTLNNASPRIEDCLISRNYTGIRRAYDTTLSQPLNPLSKGCVISSNTEYGIWINHAIVSVEDSIISGNGGYGIYYSSGGAMNILRSTVTYNNSYGIYASMNCNSGDVEISSSVISHNYYGVYANMSAGGDVKVNNSAINFNDQGLYIRGGEGVSNNIEIEQNKVESNNGYGIGLYYVSWAKVVGNRISNNGSDGLQLRYNYSWRNAEILNNLISDNHGAGIYLGWDVVSWFDRSIIMGNTIMNNRNSGIVGALTNSDSTKFQLKCTYNNITGNTPYNLSWQSSMPLSAENNWWGTTDAESIESAIYHYADNPSLGRVEYTPYLTSFCEEVPPDTPGLIPVTEVSGIITTNTIWKYPGIYVVKDNVTVNSGVTLTIEPGVDIWVRTSRSLTVNGALVSQGTENRKILFTSQSINPIPGKWIGIVFNDSSDDNTSIIKHATIEYAESGITLNNASPRIENCLIARNYYGINRSYDSTLTTPINPLSKGCVISSNTYNGIMVNHAIISVEDSVISDNGAYGIYFSSGGSMEIINSTITRNQNCGIYASLCDIGDVKINNCVITHNQYAGLYCRYGIKAEINNSKVISNNGYGIELRNIYVAKITNNQVSQNTNDGIRIREEWQSSELANNLISDNQGAGINLTWYVASYTNQAKIMGNTITGNQNSGITGAVSSENKFQLLFADNNIFGNAPYDVNWQSSIPLDAENNWWGTDDKEIISQHIYDFYDNSNVGKITYEPYLVSPWPNTLPPADITDLVAYAGPGLREITLVWTSPGNDGNQWNIVGGKYKIVYSNVYPVASTEIVWSTNTTHGKLENYRVTGLANNTTYWFYVMTCDEAGNWSEPSNTANTKTYAVSESTDGLVSLIYEFATLEGKTTDVFINIESTTTEQATIAISTATDSGFGTFSSLYDFGPTGTVFSKPAGLTFYYIDPPYGEETLNVYKYDENIGGWQPLTKLEQNTTENWIKVEITSLSLFVVLIDIKPPEIVINSLVENKKYVATVDKIKIDFAVTDNTDPAPQYSFYLTDLEDGTTMAINIGDEIEPLTIDDGFWTLTINAKDWIGNVSSKTVKFEVIHDIQPPRTALTIGNPKYDNYITSGTLITLNATDDLINVEDGKGLGVKETKYRIDNGDWQVYTTSFTVPIESSHTVTYYSVDIIGNTEQSQTLNLTVDNTAPVTEITVSSPQCTSDGKLWISSETAIILSATDGGIIPCGVKYTEYRINDGQWTNYTTGFNLTGPNGSYTIVYYSADNLDNLETYKTLTVQLDTTPPVTAVTIAEPKYVSDEKIWITSSTAITLISTDSGCGVKNMEYKIDDDSYTAYLSTFCLTTLPEGEHTIYFRSTDNLNNPEQEKSVEVIVDNTPPATSVSIGSPKYAADGKIWINNYSPISLSAEDGGITPSGVKSIAYKIDNSAWQLYAGAFDLGMFNEGEHTIYYYSADNVNNTEQLKSIKVILDITPPETAMSSSEPKYDNYITSNTIFALSPIDGGIIPSGAKYSQYNINNQFWSIYIQQFNITGLDGIYTINYQSIDNVENWETIKSTTVKLDNTAPVSALTISDGKQYTSSDGKLYASIDTKYIISAEDPVINEVASGLSKIEYSIDGSSFTIYTTSITLTEGIHTITYRAIDKLGNAESVKTFNVNVDNTSPVTQHTINGIQHTSDGKTYITPASVIGFTMIDPEMLGVASGVSYTKCRIDAGEFQNIPSTYTFTLMEGIHTVEYYSTDNVNNTESVKQITLYVDNTAPITDIIIGTPKYTAFGETYISPRTPILITATDPVSNNVSSGVDEIQYSIDGSDFVKYVSSFTLTEGSHTIDYRSIDNVQNMETTKLLKLNVVYISEYAVFGVDEIKINGQGKVYGNARSNGNVKLSGQAFINGDVFASSITLTGQSIITGTIIQNATAISTSAIDLASLQTQVSQNNDNSNIPKTQKGKTALVNGILTLSGQDVLIITTGTYYLAGINLSGQTKLYLNGVVRIFCTGKIQVSGQSEVRYSGANPYNLIIYCNTTEPVTISGQGEMKGIIYAPSSDISISGQGITLSNVFGKTVSVGGQGKIVGATYTQPPMLAVGIPKPAPPVSDFVLGEVYSYPNPAKRGKCPTLHIEVGLADILEVRIYNVAGELVHSAEISGSNYKTINGKYAYEYNWDISNIASGVYIYLVRAKKNGYHDIKVQGKCAIIK